MNRNDFLNIPIDVETVDPVTAQPQNVPASAPQPATAQPTGAAFQVSAPVAQPVAVQPKRSSAAQQFIATQWDQTQVNALNSVAQESARLQAELASFATDSASTIGSFLLSGAKLLVLGAWALWGQVALNPTVLNPTAKNLVKYAPTGSGIVAAADVPFTQQHWAIQGQTRWTVNAVLSAFFISVLIMFQPKTASAINFKRNLLVFLALLIIPVNL